MDALFAAHTATVDASYRAIGLKLLAEQEVQPDDEWLEAQYEQMAPPFEWSDAPAEPETKPWSQSSYESPWD